MNAQNTPVHISLWHHDFWLMAFANLFLSMSVYLLIPAMPHWLTDVQNLTHTETGLVMGAFGIGLFFWGAFVSYFVQHYRRNIVCVWGIISIVIILALFYYLESLSCQFIDFPLILFLRFALGASYGLSQMVLTSTLIIDTCESFQRTEANYSAAWFGRFALSIGPVAGLILERLFDYNTVFLASIVCATCSLVLIMLAHFPFRTPSDEVPTFSLDRFFLSQGLPLFLNLFLITTALGLILSLSLTEHFYAMMMAGFLVALLCWRFVFRDAELKSEVVTGLILMGAALLMLITRTQQIVWYAAPFFVGLGIGIIGSRFLLFFIKLSRHCQRGTSQSTYMLGWESGIAIGLGLGFILDDMISPLIVSLALVSLALIIYQFTHKWYVQNKNR